MLDLAEDLSDLRPTFWRMPQVAGALFSKRSNGGAQPLRGRLLTLKDLSGILGETLGIACKFQLACSICHRVAHHSESSVQYKR